MATLTWNKTSGTFSDGGNWSPSGPPGTGDTASFGTGGGVITGNGSVGFLQTDNAGNWTFSNSSIAAKSIGANGTDVLQAGAKWNINGTPSSNGYMVIGGGTNVSGTVLVTLGATITSTQAADTGTYGLYVGSGAGLNGKGILAIDGAGSLVDMGANGATVGQTGQGQIVMTNGATARFASSNSSLISALALGRGGNGGVSLDTGSTVTADGFVSVGRGGNANLNVTGGSSFTGGATAASKGGAASFNVGDSNAAGSATPYFGGSAILNVLKGSTVHALAGMNVGYDGSHGSITVDGAGSILKADGTVQIGGGLQRPGGTGVVVVSGGGTMRTGAPATGLSGMAIGTGMPGDEGTVTVIGTGSLLDTNGYRLSIGTSSTSNTQRTGAKGTLSIMDGGKVTTGASYADSEAALAVGALGGGNGTLTIDGPGSILVAAGSAVIGGTDAGSGVTQGGTGTVRVTNGATLQTGAETIQSGSTVTVDASSKLVAPSVTINGGTLDLGSLTTANAISFGTGGMLTVHSVTGANAIGNFSYGDAIDVKGATSVSAASGVITTATGSVSIGAAPAGAGYQIADDGDGGTVVSLSPQTIGVFRFFESTNGTHFYTTDAGEAKGLSDPSSPSYRPDLIQEASGFGAYGVAPSDPNQVKVFRFFDAAHGTEFLTASKSEADGLIDKGSSTYRADLKLEPNGSFYEHLNPQAGDVAVYRFFDSVLGTHFYTASEGERADIASMRPDLIAEGIGFYAPSGMARQAA